MKIEEPGIQENQAEPSYSWHSKGSRSFLEKVCALAGRQGHEMIAQAECVTLFIALGKIWYKVLRKDSTENYWINFWVTNGSEICRKHNQHPIMALILRSSQLIQHVGCRAPSQTRSYS